MLPDKFTSKIEVSMLKGVKGVKFKSNILVLLKLYFTKVQFLLSYGQIYFFLINNLGNSEYV